LDRYNLGCMAANDMLFDSRVKLSNEGIAQTEGLRDGNQFWD